MLAPQNKACASIGSLGRRPFPGLGFAPYLGGGTSSSPLSRQAIPWPLAAHQGDSVMCGAPPARPARGGHREPGPHRGERGPAEGPGRVGQNQLVRLDTPAVSTLRNSPGGPAPGAAQRGGRHGGGTLKDLLLLSGAPQTPGEPPRRPSAPGPPLAPLRPLRSSRRCHDPGRRRAGRCPPSSPARPGPAASERGGARVPVPVPVPARPRLPRPRSAPASGPWVRAGRGSAPAPRGPRARGARGRSAPPGSGR